MHFLDRSRVATPNCLAGPTDGWTYSDLRGAEKAEIRQALLELQEHRCAYCERRTGDHQSYDGHIEHFRDQAGHKHLSVDWENLFWSCNDERTCGKHKDQCRGRQGPYCRFDPADLIDPSRDDPEQYLLFVSDGAVAPRHGLDDVARRRATETIRVFQLNESAYLARARLDAVRPYLRMVDTLLALGPEPLRTYLESELQANASAPFATAIKQYLESVMP